MITFKQYIQEGFSKDFDLEKFKTDCAFYLKECKGFPIYHGADEGTNNYTIETFHFREKPRDTKKDVHDIVNNTFHDMYGIKPRDWLFVTGNKIDARDYGQPFVIVPIGKFDWVSSPDFKDLTRKFNKIFKPIWDNHSENAREKAIEQLVSEIKSADWNHNRAFYQCVISCSEIMIKCDQFYSFNTNGEVYNNEIEPFLKSLRKN
jgi:hypothetical protein